MRASLTMSWWLYVFLFLVFTKLYQVLTMGICKCKIELDGKLVIITGANSGIGFETAKDMARRGAKVILGCRNPKRGLDAEAKIIEATGNKKVFYKHLDLSSLTSVRTFAEDVLKSETRLDILINNAGAGGLGQKTTKDGIIVEYQINHFGPFLLTNLLLPLLKKSAPSRIVNVSSMLHWLGTTDFTIVERNITIPGANFLVYSNTKLWNIYFTKELSRRLDGTGVVANCLHPGSVKSEIYRNGSRLLRLTVALGNTLLFKNEVEGAQTTIHVAVSPECEVVSGEYFSDCKLQYLAPKAKNEERAIALWELSAKLVHLNSNNNDNILPN